MGHGYLWAAALEICASYGYGMSIVLLGLGVVLGWKRRRVGILLVTISTLALGLLGASSWLLYLGRFSAERVALDRVDHQIILMVDRERRVRLLIDRRFEAAIPAGQIEAALDLAREYLTELKESAAGVSEDLESLKPRFRVGATPTLEMNRRALTKIFSRLGLVSAAAALLIATAYLAPRFWGTPGKAADIGCAGTLVVLVGSLLVLTPSGEIHPLALISLLMPGTAAVALYLGCRRESARLPEVIGSLTLVLAAGLFALSANGYLFYGENDLRRKIGAMDQALPGIQARARSLGESIDALAESAGRSAELAAAVADLWPLSYNLYIAIGGLEEQLGNTDERAGSMDDYRRFDPYKEEFQRFRRDPLGDLPSPPSESGAG